MLLFVLLAFLTPSFASPLQNGAYSLSESNDLFTRSFFDTIRSKPGNIFFSPVSIQAALGMLYSGANGETAHQLKTYGYLPANKQEASAILGGSLKSLNIEDDKLTLKLANALFCHQSLSVKKEYASQLSTDYGAALFPVNFNNKQVAVNKINTWVVKNTNNKIKEIVTEEELDPTTELVLLNAIYFKGMWKSPFNKELTEKSVFHKSTNEQVMVDFMFSSNNVRVKYDDDLDADILELPYEGDVSMILVVPKKIDGLKSIEPKLLSLSVQQLLQGAYKRQIEIRMPKFKVEKTIVLNEPLIQMGLSDMFLRGKANFSDISTPSIYVSAAIQKSYIEVNEEGSEAAAVTAVLAGGYSSYFIPIEKITMDKPFLYYIYHQPTATTLFFGRLSSP